MAATRASAKVTSADRRVVTPRQAKAILQDVWLRRERARWIFDPLTLSKLETGVSHEVDHAIGLSETLRGVRGRSMRSMVDFAVIVPRQVRYPAWFFAEVLTDSYDDDPYAAPSDRLRTLEMMVFTKKGPRARWRLAFDATPGTPRDTAVDEALTNDRSYPYSVRPFKLDWVGANTLHEQLAAYWQHWRDAKEEPTTDVFAPGYWTTTRGKVLASTTIPDADCNCVPEVRYYVDPADGSWTIPARYGGDTPVNYVCSTVRIAITYRPLPGQVLTQDDNHENWGPMILPGDYVEIRTESPRTSCILVQQVKPAYVLGGDNYETSIVGVPAPPRT
jgi:hypothetical protein